MGSGRRADVYDIGNGRVLRRYRDPTAGAEREAQVMVHARAHGVPVPEVFGASGTDIVMAYVAGPTMLQDLTRRPWTLERHAGLLAALHRKIHAVEALSSLRAPFGDGSVLLHTDVHPSNVILTKNGPQVIDWEAAARGPAAVDVALTWVIIATSQIPGPPLQRAVGWAGQGLFARRYLAAVGPLGPRWRAVAAEYRLRDPTVLPAEAATLRRMLADTRLGDEFSR
ncbi:MAG TPA: phosphotransferase [Streptosporangiaceae bacterium]|nr:phosphotransferase [Streptosporangiaceae bacterium]